MGEGKGEDRDRNLSIGRQRQMGIRDRGPEICRTEYECECWTKQEVHDVEDDVVSCKTEVEEKCEDNTSGYTTNTKCSQWPR